jgi:preprotein translocase subunit SecY
MVIGATFLGLNCCYAFNYSGIYRNSTFSFLIGGTSLLIIVSVALETMSRLTLN